MDISIFFARFYGLFYVIVGLLTFATKFLGRVIERSENENFTMSTGYTSLLIGLVTVVLHNLWVVDWRIAITLFGWSTLIKGMLKIGAPNFIHKQALMFKKKQNLEAVMLFLMGAWLLWMAR